MFNHVALRVRDIAASVEFHQVHFGCKSVYISEPGSEHGGVALCALPDGRMIELFEEGNGYGAVDARPIGLIHYALSVDDVDAAFHAALADGCTQARPPTDNELALFPGIWFRTAFVFDRNGTVIEFMEHNWTDRIFAVAGIA
jgi:catechol 2,3-dioxygenase-like lactoylglutathione lyase family enzyme